MSNVSYTVYATRVDKIDPSTLQTEEVDAFVVNRVEFNAAWFIGRYATEQTANAVAGILIALAAQEV